jgi:hypothetical protein
MKKTIFVLLFLCLGLQGILGYKIWKRMKMEALDVKPPTLTFRAARQIFPFSVIPGGVLDERELADSIAKDEVVRKHYGDLEPDRMWFTRTKEPMAAYVSYRKGSDVRWTSHPVTIPANELVLTDGKHMVRARCGNRIEVKKPEPLPAQVIPPDIPPPDIAMETGLPSLIPPTVTPPVPPASQLASQLARNNGTPPPSRISTPPTTWCCGLTTSTLPSVPEPPTVLLVLGGGLFLVSMVLGKKLF